MINKAAIISLLSLFFLYNSQVTVLGPPSVVSRVKEMENGSNYIIL
jgi:hypothetical protein